MKSKLILKQNGIIKNRILRTFLFAIGLLALLSGFIGIFLPVFPTTPFLLVAAWCFVRSSPRAHQWLYRQPVFGKILKQWDETQSISRTTKIFAITMILISLGFIWLKMKILWVKTLLTLILTGTSLFIGTRKEQ